MKIEFTKMHGTANDYIFIDCMKTKKIPFDPARLARKMSERRFSVGADGVVLICASDAADAKMRMFNADGSEGEMCGNAARCIGRYLWDNGICTRDEIRLETRSGTKRIERAGDQITVHMGTASFPMEDVRVRVRRKKYHLTPVFTGNPHAVCFVGGDGFPDVGEVGPLIGSAPEFPARANVEFVRQTDRTRFEARIWERGSGETWSCGTGVCAAAAAAVRKGFAPAKADLVFSLRGGELTVRCSSFFGLTLTGPAVTVYRGEYEYDEDPAE